MRIVSRRRVAPAGHVHQPKQWRQTAMPQMPAPMKTNRANLMFESIEIEEFFSLEMPRVEPFADRDRSARPPFEDHVGTGDGCCALNWHRQAHVATVRPFRSSTSTMCRLDGESARRKVYVPGAVPCREPRCPDRMSRPSSCSVRSRSAAVRGRNTAAAMITAAADTRIATVPPFLTLPQSLTGETRGVRFLSPAGRKICGLGRVNCRQVSRSEPHLAL